MRDELQNQIMAVVDKVGDPLMEHILKGLDLELRNIQQAKLSSTPL